MTTTRFKIESSNFYILFWLSICFWNHIQFQNDLLGFWTRWIDLSTAVCRCQQLSGSLLQVILSNYTYFYQTTNILPPSTSLNLPKSSLSSSFTESSHSSIIPSLSTKITHIRVAKEIYTNQQLSSIKEKHNCKCCMTIAEKSYSVSKIWELIFHKSRYCLRTPVCVLLHNPLRAQRSLCCLSRRRAP